MIYVPFHEYFHQIAEKETRSFIVFEGSELPARRYGLLEMYCGKSGSDCRRVFFSVVSSLTNRIEAVIAYGWENVQRIYRQAIRNKKGSEEKRR